MDHRTETSMRASGSERRLPETKTFLLSSEFWVFGIAAAAMLFAAYALDDLREPTAWRLCAFIAIGYIVSRGIAKAGSRRDYMPDFRGDDRGYGYGDRSAAQTAEEEWAQRRSEAVARGVDEPRGARVTNEPRP